MSLFSIMSQMCKKDVSGGTNMIGDMYNKSSWGDLSDFTGATTGFAASAGSITCSDMRVKMASANISGPVSITAYFDTATGKAVITDSYYNLVVSSTSTLPNPVNGDIVTVRITKTKGAYTVTVIINGSPISASRSMAFNSVTTQDISNNTSWPAISDGTNDLKVNQYNRLDEYTWSATGTKVSGGYQVTNMTFNSTMLKGKDTGCGNSISAGNNAGSAANRWASLLNLNINAGPGDKTREVLLGLPQMINFMQPKKVYLMIGTNNANDATYHTEHQSIVSQLQSAGITVVVMTPPAKVGTDMSGHRDWIAATYPGQYVDVFAATKNPGDNFLQSAYNTDNTHPNAAGHAAIAGAITASGL